MPDASITFALCALAGKRCRVDGALFSFPASEHVCGSTAVIAAGIERPLRAARVRAAVAVLRAVAAACFFWAARHASKLERKSRSVISTRVCSCGSAAQKVAAASACSSMALSSCATEVRAARAISKKPVAIS
jgi:hypothetical protein